MPDLTVIEQLRAEKEREENTTESMKMNKSQVIKVGDSVSATALRSRHMSLLQSDALGSLDDYREMALVALIVTADECLENKLSKSGDEFHDFIKHVSAFNICSEAQIAIIGDTDRTNVHRWVKRQRTPNRFSQQAVIFGIRQIAAFRLSNLTEGREENYRLKEFVHDLAENMDVEFANYK